MVRVFPEFFNVVMQNAGAIQSPRIIAPELMQGKRIFTIFLIFFASNPCFFIEFCKIAPKMVQQRVRKPDPLLFSNAEVNAAKT